MMDHGRPIGAVACVLALFILSAASLNSPGPGSDPKFVPAPDEGCVEATLAPGATPVAGLTESCQGAGTGSEGAGAGALGNVLPLVAIVVGGILVIALGGAVLVIRSRPRVGAEPIAGWWTCAACGSSNLAEAARCHKCGAWQPFSQSRRGGRITP